MCYLTTPTPTGAEAVSLLLDPSSLASWTHTGAIF